MTARFDLAAALASGAKVIDVPVGRHEVGSLVLTRAVTVRGGPGVVLDGKGAHGLFRVEAPGVTVTLEGLTFENGDAHAGGAVHLAQGALVLDACAFFRCTAHKFGGGAVYATGEALTVKGCQFLENLGRQGGALLLDGVVEATVTGSQFTRNAAVQGGAIRLREGATLTVERSTFHENRAVPRDGAAALGHTFFLSGSTTRAPTLSVDGATVVSHGASTADECHRDPKVGGTARFHDCLLPESMRGLGLGDSSCRYGAPAR